MAPPSTHPKAAEKSVAFGPHPDDVENVRAGLQEAERGELLSAEESEVYMRWLETGTAPANLAEYFETGDPACRGSRF